MMSRRYRRRTMSRSTMAMGATAAVLVAGGAAFALSSAGGDGGDMAGTAPDLGAGAGTGPGTGPGTAPGTTPGTTPGTEPEKTPGKKPGNGAGQAAAARFAPYIDTSLHVPYDMVGTAKKTGVKEFTLGFVSPGGGCTPKWGGRTGLAADKVARQTQALRAEGGDIRVSFGGQSGSELALACPSMDKLTAAYSQVVDRFKLTKVDFDIEGKALENAAASTRRAQAIAALQKQNPGLDVSFTLPVMPTGLTRDGAELVADARKNGVKVSAVNIMAMDYGSSFDGDMGRYAIDAATATQKQLKRALGLGDAAAWKTVGVTPMIGVNDVKNEIFTVDDATELVRFARAKGLGKLSMWSATRDKQCAGGTQATASAICSSVEQGALAFTKALGGYRG
ncbi:chitinase domain protein [Streptomyces himastatinicus ATCC 53653]|uniref:chitinase n=2 Tax=Streptomyces violaceusniger group TaxID=2839105 RepID=D9WNM7_9ACTN|nr:chitinase domain protein [Streptomyces himastatinicus ATCC 53653]